MELDVELVATSASDQIFGLFVSLFDDDEVVVAAGLCVDFFDWSIGACGMNKPFLLLFTELKALFSLFGFGELAC